MANNKNISKWIRAIFIILLVFTVSNFVYTPQVEAAESSMSAWEKIKSVTTDVINTLTHPVEAIVNKARQGLNPCKTKWIDPLYSGGCHACKVVKVMMSTFINACSVLEGTAKEAGTKILLLCFPLWLIIFILRQLSSLKDVEPMNMVNELVTMFFKVLCTYLVIQFGFDLVLNYLIVPFLGWGVDFGGIMLDAAVEHIDLNNPDTNLDVADKMSDVQGFLPASIFNNIMEYIAKINAAGTVHMKLGHMVSCHARHMGQWTILKFIHITNFFTWLAGVAIWILAFFVIFFVCFYLLDVSFKLAIAMVFLPVLAAFWPFGALRSKCLACVKMVFNAAAIFVFLALTTSMGLVLVDKALQIGEIAMDDNLTTDSVLQVEPNGKGISALMQDINDGDTDAVSYKFSLFSVPFLMLIFCFLYAIKIIGSTINDYVNTFFADSLGGKMQEIHKRMTGVATLVKQKSSSAAKRVKDNVVKPKAKDLLDKLGRKIRTSSNKFDRLKDGKTTSSNEKDLGDIKQTKDSNTVQNLTQTRPSDKDAFNDNKAGEKASTSGAAETMKAAGEATEKSGEAIENATKQAAEAQKKAGEGISKAGDAVAEATFGAGAAVAVAGHAADASLQASAVATEVAGKVIGKALKVSGKAMKQSAKTMRRMERASMKAKKVMKKVKKTADRVQKVADNINKIPSPQDNKKSEDENKKDKQGKNNDQKDI